MKQAWNSFLQTVFQFVKSLVVNVSKKMHRDSAVLMTGFAVATVIAFAAGDFGGGGKSAIVAFAETTMQTDKEEAELEETEGAALPVEEAETSESNEQNTEDTDREGDIEETEKTSEISQSEELEMTEDKDQATEDTNQETEGADQETESANQETEGTDQETEDADQKNDGINQEVEDTDQATEDTDGIQAVDDIPEEEEEIRVYACSESDYNVLLKIVQAEAGNCDIEGRILVANVILNRVEDDDFPNTITGVVYERSQFSPVSNGTINTCKVTQDTIEAVDRALAGEDLSDGALYFMNRRTASKRNVRWFDSHLDYLFRHGNHEFFK